MKLSDLILGQPEVSIADFEFRLTLLKIIVVVCGIFFFIFFLSFKSKALRVIAFMIGLAVVIGSPTIATEINPETLTPASETNSSRIAAWAEENYLVSISASEANILYDGKIVSGDTSRSARNSAEAVATYYDEPIMVQLVNANGAWKLFNNGKELPLVEANKK